MRGSAYADEVPATRPSSATEFAEAVASIRNVALPVCVSVQEVPAPSRVAPYSLALSADVEDQGEELGHGRFVILHDPAGQEGWDGTVRVVTFAQADLEPELGEDPLLSEIGWSWLTESLEPLPHTALGGTVTRVMSNSHGTLADRPATVSLEVRASWTPTTSALGDHLQAWAGLLCTISGVPPLPDGVTQLQRGIL